jgi:hypothetical protein
MQKIENKRNGKLYLTDGSIETWGDVYYGGKNAPNAPTDKGYTEPSALRAAKALAVE